MDTTGEPLEYVADIVQLDEVPAHRYVRSVEEAGRCLQEYGIRRVRALMASSRSHPVLLLSGGIDSIFVAAISALAGFQPLTVTVSTSAGGSDESVRARKVAHFLGLEHREIFLDLNRVRELAQSAVNVLELDELWEISAAIPLLSIIEDISNDGFDLLLTGGGADVILAGGKSLVSPIGTPAADHELEIIVRESVRRSFRRDRLIPDFYQRLLGEKSNVYAEFFQTVEAWEISRSFSSSVLFGSAPAQGSGWRAYDKVCLRSQAALLGLDPQWVWTSKDPLQTSSGVVNALGQLARIDLAGDGTSTTYADPLSEPSEHVVARQWLRQLINSAGADT